MSTKVNKSSAELLISAPEAAETTIKQSLCVCVGFFFSPLFPPTYHLTNKQNR